MGRTFKDESFGADGKFRNRQRSHTRRVNTGRQQAQPVFSEPFDDKDELYDTSSEQKESMHRDSQS